ncbi:MAG TPA: hypothetical protein VKZ59_08160, partial [Acidobacteriota bacterium]|nr:hypothetical protein [Acidobacteriota bacterium]
MSLLSVRLLSKRTGAILSLLVLFGFVFTVPIFAQTPTPPHNEPGYPDNLFFGEVPPEGKAPVIVFVHGLRGVASDWFEDNNTYALAYAAGYRTAFVSLSPDNTRNDASVEDNAQVLRSLLPQVASFYGTSDLYIVAHSKGGVDVQAALLDPTLTDLDPTVAGLVRALFMIATPNQGTELADWAFGEGQEIADELGLLTPGVASMQTTEMALFRAQADPLLEASGIRFFTMGGSVFIGHPLTAITGPILTALSGSSENDGMVTVESSRLHPELAQDLGKIPANHFRNDQGHQHFGRIHFHIAAMESPIASNFELNVPDGFG